MEYPKILPNEEIQDIVLSYTDITIILKNELSGDCSLPLHLSKITLAMNLPYFHMLFQTFKEEKEFIINIINIPVAQYILLRLHKIDYTPNVSNEELVLYEICICSYFCAPINLDPLYKFSEKIENYDLLYETLNCCNYATNEKLLAVLRRHIPPHMIQTLPENIMPLIQKPQKLFMARNKCEGLWQLYNVELGIIEWKDNVTEKVFASCPLTNIAVYAGYDRTYIMDMETSTEKYVLYDVDYEYIKISPSGNYIADWGGYRTTIYDLNRKSEITLRYKIASDKVFAFSRDDLLFAVVEKFIDIYDISGKELVGTIHEKDVIAMEFMNSGELISVRKNGTICKWDIGAFKCSGSYACNPESLGCHIYNPVNKLNIDKSGTLLAVALSRDDRLFAILCNNSITVIDLLTKEKMIKQVCVNKHNILLMFSDDNDYIAYFDTKIRHMKLDYFVDNSGNMI